MPTVALAPFCQCHVFHEADHSTIIFRVKCKKAFDLFRGLCECHCNRGDHEMANTILIEKQEAADEYARDIGGVWIVYGNPNRLSHTLDIRITQEDCAADFMLAGDVVLYRTEGVAA